MLALPFQTLLIDQTELEPPSLSSFFFSHISLWNEMIITCVYIYTELLYCWSLVWFFGGAKKQKSTKDFFCPAKNSRSGTLVYVCVYHVGHHFGQCLMCKNKNTLYILAKMNTPGLYGLEWTHPKTPFKLRFTVCFDCLSVKYIIMMIFVV